MERKKLKIHFLDLFVDRVHFSYKVFFFSFPSSSFKECIVILNKTYGKAFRVLLLSCKCSDCVNDSFTASSGGSPGEAGGRS